MEKYRVELKNHYLNNSIVINLSNKDFVDGTYIISKPGLYRLKENIIFEPKNFSPTSEIYNTDAYSLDFFSAISVKCSDVIIDGNGHEIGMSLTYLAAQRFFSIIELADTPFLPGQGPGNFGSTITSGNKVIIENITLSNSSHHCLRSNKSWKVYVRNAILKNFEVAGMAFNGGHNFQFKNIKIGPTLENPPVNAFFSAARFLPRFLERLKDKVNEDELIKLNSLKNTIEERTNNVLKEIKDTGETSDEFFRNKFGIPDGNVYGILMHSDGVAINDFNTSDKKIKKIKMKNIEIDGLKCKVTETVGISGKNGVGVQTDSTGAIFDILSNTDENGNYKGDILSEIRLFIAEMDIKYGLTSGKNNITQDLINWSKGFENISYLLSLGYKYKCNGDVMFHVNKGLMGIRLDSCYCIKLDNIYISNLYNIGYLGNDIIDNNYSISHDMQKFEGYTGNRVIGISVNDCDKFSIDNVEIENLFSRNGNCDGVWVFNKSNGQLCNSHIKNLTCGNGFNNGKCLGIGFNGDEREFSANLPNKIPCAFGIKIEKNSNVEIGSYKIENIKAPGIAGKLIYLD